MRHLDMTVRLRHMGKLGFAPRTIVDVGAADGAWSRMAAAIWPGARIIAFEARESSRPLLEKTQRDLTDFSYHICVLGAKRGHVSFADRGHQTSLYATHATGHARAEMRSLDEFAETGLMPQPDLIKLDVQGYELEVLTGGQRAIEQAQAVLAEVSLYRFHPAMPTADELIEFLRGRGLVLYDVMEPVRLLEDDALGHLDLLFLRSDHPLRKPRSW